MPATTSAAARAAAPSAGKSPSSRIWMDGKLVSKEDAKVSVYDHGFLYGDGCFEGIRVYNGRVFKLDTHLRRLYDSAKKIHLKPPYTLEEIKQAVHETVKANGHADAYIRLIFSRGVGTLGLNPNRCPRPDTIIIVDKIQLYPSEVYDTGMKVIVAQRPRIPIACLDPAIKSLNYLNNILAKVEAIEAGVLEAIMLNVEGYVSECTGDNIFMVKGGKIITPAPNSGFLYGVTRRFVIETLAPALGYKIDEKLIRLEDLLKADEIFLTGTAAEIIGVNQVDDRRIGNGGVGPVTRALMSEFRKRVAKEAPED